MNGSVRPSVCPSVCLCVCLSVTHLRLVSHHHIIMEFSRVITNDRSDDHAKGQGHGSKVKVTEVMTQLSLFRTIITSVWIHIWWWNDAQCLMCVGEVPFCFSRSFIKFQGHTAKNRRFWPNWAFPDCNTSFKSPMATKWCTKLEVA